MWLWFAWVYIAWPWLRVNGAYALSYGLLAASGVTYGLAGFPASSVVTGLAMGGSAMWTFACWRQRRAMASVQVMAETYHQMYHAAAARSDAAEKLLLRRDNARWS